MSIDRILQLKLVTDVGDISRKMGQVDSQVGRVQGAFRGLRSFAGPLVIDAALTGLSMLGDALSTGMQDVRDYDNAVFGLGQRLGDAFEASEVERIASDLTAIGSALGFGDDAALVRGLEEATTRLGDLELGQRAVALAMDVARAKGIAFDDALALVVKGVDGSSKSMKALGLEADTVEGRMAELDEELGTSAEKFAETDEGMRQVMDAMSGDIWETFGGAVNDAIDEAVPALLGLWQEWQPVLLQIAEQAGPVFDRVREAIQAVIDVFIALVPHIQAAWDIIEPFATMMAEFVVGTLDTVTGSLDALAQALRGDFAGAWESIVGVVKGAINNIIRLWNSLDFALDFDFDGPGIPNPLGGWFVEPIGIHIHTGDIIPDVPMLASGGIVTRPTLALIGEGGPEAVVPLGMAGMGGDVTINMGIVTDPAATGRAIVEAIQAYERRAGARWRAA